MPDQLPAGLAVVVDREACLGTGMCIVYAPSTFAHDDETKAVLQDPPHDSADEVAAAVEACPVGALAVHAPVPPRQQPAPEPADRRAER